MAKEKKENDETKNKITKGMSFAEVLQRRPQAGGIMFKYGLHCVGCHIAAVETIEQGCLAHGMSEEDMEKMLEEINNSYNKSKKE